MRHLPAGIVCRWLLLLMLISFAATIALAQFETGTVSGQVSDPSGLSVTGAQVNLVDIDRGTSVTASTNNSGLYRFASVHPGRYRMEVRASGFQLINATGLTVNVQDHLEQNFKLAVGSVSESVTVEGGAPLVDTESGTVSTIVDRQFAENLPMNGRSFQTLIELTPGVVLTPSTPADPGQFSVNGQRTNSNYVTVDGVSGNIGVASSAGSGFAGALGSFSAQGGTNSLVSVDALQEFRIQTSTYAPEFGRTPGAQISILTRSGTNQFHGTAFDYLRNDLLDANDWFADRSRQPKPEERQNDFGGTFSGPILKNRTFFFFSYEGLRLRLPQFAQTAVPDLNARSSANSAVQPFLNAYPLPNGPQAVDMQGNPIASAAQLNASFSNKATLDAYSIRIDHRLSDKLTLMGRDNDSPSELDERGGGIFSLSQISQSPITTQTATVGATWTISQMVNNDLRFNYSRTNSGGSFKLDDFGGAVPPTALPLPAPYTRNNGVFLFDIVSLVQGTAIEVGNAQRQIQRQINLVDSLSVQRGRHSLKFGIDFRRLTPVFDPYQYGQGSFFSDVPSAGAGNLAFSDIVVQRGGTSLFRNLSQDSWRIVPRLTLTYGLRWDVDFAPSSSDGPSVPAVTGYNLNDLSNLALAPAGTPAFHTKYGNVAPRIGVAYQLFQNANWESVLRGGFGIFYDLATSETGNLIAIDQQFYPFGATTLSLGGNFPPASVNPPQIDPTSLAIPPATLVAFDPHLKMPYTFEWNFALEQALGRQQTLSASYLGSAGRRLIQTTSAGSPNANFANADLVTNFGASDYDALQFQFQRRLSHGLQALASYSWAHSIDTGSAGSTGVGSNAITPGFGLNTNRGPSDFDTRQSVSAAVTYEISAPKTNPIVRAILHGWSLQNVVQARTALPVNVFYSFYSFFVSTTFADVRPDVAPGIPLYLYGQQYPGGKAFNSTPGAVAGGCSDGSQSIGPFCPPPVDPNTGRPLRQGTLGRNALRGFGPAQWDFAVHRDFPIRESLRLQFRAEMFNVLNHPNFGQPIGDLQFPLFPNPQFGQSTQMLGRSLSGGPSGNLGGGAFDPLYQIGGPRSIQMALKLTF